MNQREKNVFKAIHASMMSGLPRNAAVQRRLNELYRHMVKNARPGSLGVLVGKGGIRKNAEGQSDLMATFVALGMVHKPFRAELEQIQGPKNFEKNSEGDTFVDTWLRNGANTIINYLTQSALLQKYTAPDMYSQLMALGDALADIQAERVSTTERMIMKPQQIMDSKIAKLIETGSKKGVKFIKEVRGNTDNKYLKNGLLAAQIVAAFGNKDDSADIGDALMRHAAAVFSILNQQFKNLIACRETTKVD